ncbi:hypothetical protein PAXRUDRAFT_259759 [Paxillus rubicundulus Ve08.2h10]|uniref:Uncharacterized protein n=1 Tax=Paxillus rubicundulus Ve08.2h10 TaxID=930991 RepID=A0A0D0E0N5_9AGAM|nr:hypothetical protein PAXRUDRAFT_259759 [Paxillus rubicundulus Ve08.2h10]
MIRVTDSKDSGARNTSTISRLVVMRKSRAVKSSSTSCIHLNFVQTLIISRKEPIGSRIGYSRRVARSLLPVTRIITPGVPEVCSSAYQASAGNPGRSWTHRLPSGTLQNPYR